MLTRLANVYHNALRLNDVSFSNYPSVRDPENTVDPNTPRKMFAFLRSLLQEIGDVILAI